jgi:hypothetical protein
MLRVYRSATAALRLPGLALMRSQLWQLAAIASFIPAAAARLLQFTTASQINLPEVAS